MDKNFVEKCERSVKSLIENRSVLIRYMRDKQGSPYGVLVGVRCPDGSVGVGHSVCNVKKDSFNRKVGVYIAAQRAFKDKMANIAVDEPLTEWYDKMYKRANKYWNVV